jgi:hypothetical protein
MNQRAKAELLEAIHSREYISGLTHEFYRYPARFSPLFARAAIKALTQPGDIVLDPFMGGGTTLVEAHTLGRKAIGTDINALAVFVSTVKTTSLTEASLSEVRSWANALVKNLNLRSAPAKATNWAELGYQRNIADKATWPIRKILELALDHVGELATGKQQRFARCVLLRTAQWALDCRTHIPSAEQFRQQFLVYLNEMIESAREYTQAVRQAEDLHGLSGPFRILCLNRSTVNLDTDKRLKDKPAPALILTSPPYPGTHVLYHRWQIQGRKETPAPFWIAGSLDSKGESFYTFGSRKEANLSVYYQQAKAAFSSLARIANDKTTLVQLVAFSAPSWQLPKYLDMMKESGFREIRYRSLSNSPDNRIWRCVPNRKWYANQQGDIPTSKEVVLFHRLA